MADDLKLEIVIQALLDAKGFEDAKANLGKVAESANKAAPEVKKMGESFGGTRGPVADVTRLLLQNVGVTGAAGEAAKAAGTAMYFMEGAATASAVALTAGVAALAILLPKLIDFLSKTKEVDESTRQLASALDTGTGGLERMAGAFQQASEAANLLLVALHSKAMDEERQKMAEMRAEIDAYAKNMAKLGQVITDSPHIVALQQQLQLMEQAHTAGLTYAESLDKVGKEGKITAVSVEELNKALRAEAEAMAEAQRFARQQETDARLDMDAFTKKQRLELHKRIHDQTEYLDAYAKLKRQEAELDRLAAQAKFDNAVIIKSAIGSTLSSLSVLFGGNKAMAIAGAIIDTYAGATAALGMKPWTPVNYALAAAVIAQGLANVAQIRKTEVVGFDDPFADMTARQLGRQSAVDFVANFGSEFIPGVRGGMRGMGGASHNTTINRGTTNHITANGIIGSKTELLKWLGRNIIQAERVESRRTIGPRA